MKVIFLDIDGVLNAARTKERAPSGVIGVNPIMVKQLARVVKATGAEIILTSTWKKDWAPQNHDGVYLDEQLARFGLKISGMTDLQYNTYRGTGIVRWLDEHPDTSKWIVFDDDIFVDYEELGIMPYLVITSHRNGGLNEELADLAIAMLNG